MLLFICNRLISSIHFIIISKHLMLLFILLEYIKVSFYANFKTSHVIVYLGDKVRVRSDLYEFQNISCYCLSNWAGTKGKGLQIFQNISCYCLSCVIFHFCTSYKVISKHLMLLFIPHRAAMHSAKLISKHLMLLFIGINKCL